MSYYEELYRYPDEVRRAGWRHKVEQTLRFETACEATSPDSTSLLDLGCGPGALYRHLLVTDRAQLAAGYLGLDQLPAAIRDARAHAPQARFELGDALDWSPPQAQRFDEVVAIGALVDGLERREPVARRAHIHAMLDRMCQLARHGVCLIVLKQEAIITRPSLSLEPALIGVSAQEAHQIAAHVAKTHDMAWHVRERVLRTDRAIYLTRESQAALDQRAEAWAQRWDTHERALKLAQADDEARAWLWLEAGRWDAAEQALGATRAGEGGWRAILRDRLRAEREGA
jgi:SAM-dependent methyltransferase